MVTFDWQRRETKDVVWFEHHTTLPFAFPLVINNAPVIDSALALQHIESPIGAFYLDDQNVMWWLGLKIEDDGYQCSVIAVIEDDVQRLMDGA